MADSEPLHKGHTRSVSAGGELALSTFVPKSALRSRGHLRAFSQGQIEAEDSTSSSHARGHTRAPSKTDFILPPGHRETGEDGGGGKGGSGGGAAVSASNANSIVKGHSRQASNTESIYTLRNKPTPSKFRSFISFLLFRNKAKSEAAAASYTRTVVPNHLVPAPHKPNGGTNEIRTTKYTVYNFLFKNLAEQFRRAANIFFIFIIFLNWVPAINAFGKEIAMIPVMFVLGVTAVKDLCEDRQRNASDKRINSSTCRVYSGEEERYKKVTWKEIRVGDIVHLSNDEVVPADILVLRTSDDIDGVCYLDTCNLDGESNLKERNVPKNMVKRQRGFRPSDFRSDVVVDRPTTKLYEFRGAIIDAKDGRIPVTTEHLLLRDSVIKNTDFVEGIVVYTGHETKAMLNNSGPRHKCSTLEESMNRDIIWCVAMLVILCTMGSIGTVFWLDTFHYPLNVPYLDVTSSSEEAFVNFWVYIIILQTFIPLSLYVTIELSKLLQVYHIHNSLELYDAETNRRTECRALNITEQLGQIQYIFSDKTGTLTENKMVFKRCSIGGVDYNHPTAKSIKGEALSIELDPNQKLLEHIADSESVQSQKIREFLIALALCNTVVVAAHPHVDIMNASGVIEGDKSPSIEKKYIEDPASVSYQRLIESRTPTPPPQSDDFSSVPTVYASKRPKRLTSSDRTMPAMSPICSSTESSPTAQAKSSPNRPKLLNVPNMFFNKRLPKSARNSPKTSSTVSAKPIFEAESPDELALVQMAYIYNYRLVKRTPHKALISLPGENILEFEILRVLKFDSNRKCMSVVVRRPVSREIVVYTKGADSTIFPRLVDPTSESSTETQIQRYSKQGLRVLAVACRVIPEDTWTVFEAMLDSAVQPADIKQAYSTVESDLHLIGATGIEDRLQPGVPDTLKALKAAGIVVWVLTGDKIETAKNVALSSGLFTPLTEVLQLEAKSKHAAESAIECYRASFDQPELRAPTTSSRQTSDNSQKGLIIDGETLTYILYPGSRLTKPFLELAQLCSTVLCCRVTPLQKAYLVKVVKEKLRKRSLAIGDGANDVSMIQAADVGVGISGQEGMQAVMASDFAIARFRVLRPLLLVHGHWTYHRLASMVSYFFYKNAAFVFLIFWFQFFCGFSGTVMIDQMYHMLFNLFFTSLPPIALGVYDKDAMESLLMSQPSLYRYGRLGLGYQPYHFWFTLLNCIYQSLAIFYIAVAVYSETDMGIWEFGTVISSSCIFAMSGEVMLEAKYWTVLHVISVVISLGSFYAFYIFYNLVCMQCIGLTANTWVMRTTVGDYRYYFVVLLSTVVALLPRFVLNCWDNLFQPSEVTRAVVETKQANDMGGHMLVSWSRSTSSSSIFRSHDGVTKITPQVNSLTSVG